MPRPASPVCRCRRRSPAPATQVSEGRPPEMQRPGGNASSVHVRRQRPAATQTRQQEPHKGTERSPAKKCLRSARRKRGGMPRTRAEERPENALVRPLPQRNLFASPYATVRRMYGRQETFQVPAHAVPVVCQTITSNRHETNRVIQPQKQCLSAGREETAEQVLNGGAGQTRSQRKYVRTQCAPRVCVVQPVAEEAAAHTR